METGYQQLASRKEPFRLKRGTIDAYLDAKAEGDYLEMRGAKLAVAIEMLKDVFLRQPDCPCKEFHTDVDVFARLVPLIRSAIKKILADSEIPKKAISAIATDAKIRALNRVPFSWVLEAFCQNINLRVSPEDVKRFIDCRNSLVHTGDFLTARHKKDSLPSPFSSTTGEWMFLVSFLDKVFLKLLGYSGPFLDRTQGRQWLGDPKGFLE